MDIDLTCLITDLEPSDLSASQAERGRDAGAETWANAVAAGEAFPLADLDIAEAKEWAADFGAWDADEIAAWTDAETRALVLQYFAGDLRQLQALAPGDGLGGIDWTEAERLSEAGAVGGLLYATDDGRLIAYVGS